MRAAGSSAAAPTCMCAAFSGGAAAPGQVSALDGALAVARHAPSWRRSARTRCSRGISRRTTSRGSARNRQGTAAETMLQAAAERAFCCCSLARLLCLVHRLLPLALPLARTLNLSSASGRSTCSRASSTCSRRRRSCASTRRCSTHVSSPSNMVHAACSKQHFSTLSLRSRAPRCSTQLAEHARAPQAPVVATRPKHLLRMRCGSRT